jgi:diguanylate cyclase (GGDEF)-like protein
MDETQKLKDQISNLESQIVELERDLIHDNLTKLKTRAFFEEESKVYLSAISNLSNEKRQNWFGFRNLSVLFFDVDHFKKVNDTYGHDVGDEVLKKVAETIVNSLRDGDTVARWGGEEMVASLLGASDEDAKIKAESIRDEISRLTFEHDHDFRITISIGIASNSKTNELEEIIKNADTALYKAKETGRNKVVVYSEIE